MDLFKIAILQVKLLDGLLYHRELGDVVNYMFSSYSVFLLCCLCYRPNINIGLFPLYLLAPEGIESVYR
jgi:hypothetical protein